MKTVMIISGVVCVLILGSILLTLKPDTSAIDCETNSSTVGVIVWEDDAIFNEVYSVLFYTKSGSLLIKCDNDELKIEATCDMNEAAEAFFYQLVKPMADAYIKERLADE